MASTTKFEIVGIALSGTPQAIYTRTVFDWTIKANPDNVGTAYLTKSGNVFPNQYPLSAGDCVGHGDFQKDRFDEYEDVTQLYVIGEVGDYVHVIVYFEDR